MLHDKLQWACYMYFRIKCIQIEVKINRINSDYGNNISTISTISASLPSSQHIFSRFDRHRLIQSTF